MAPVAPVMPTISRFIFVSEERRLIPVSLSRIVHYMDVSLSDFTFVEYLFFYCCYWATNGLYQGLFLLTRRQWPFRFHILDVPNARQTEWKLVAIVSEHISHVLLRVVGRLPCRRTLHSTEGRCRTSLEGGNRGMQRCGQRGLQMAMGIWEQALSPEVARRRFAASQSRTRYPAWALTWQTNRVDIMQQIAAEQRGAIASAICSRC